MLDKTFIGTGYLKHPNQRTKLLAFAENRNSNLHWHGMLKKPRIHPDRAHLDFCDEAMSAWKYIVPPGSLHIDRITDRDRWTRYITKQLYDPGEVDHVLLHLDFWKLK